MGMSHILNSWTIPNWYIDPVNGNDSNTGQTSGSPLKTWAELVARWGTYSPILNQNTTIKFLTSHSDNTDPVIFRPIIGKGSLVTIQGNTPTVITAGVILSGTTNKNYTVGSNSPLITNLGATGATAQLIRNNTHNSRAWAYKSLGGNSFVITQPFVPQTPGGTVFPTEVDTWSDGDSVDLLSLTNVNIVEISPTFTDYAGNVSCCLYQLNIYTPGHNEFGVLNSVAVQECQVSRIMSIRTGSSVGSAATYFINCYIGQFAFSGDNGGFILEGGAPTVVGGTLSNVTAVLAPLNTSQMIIDGDCIIGVGLVGGIAQSNLYQNMGIYFGTTYLDAPIVLDGNSKVSASEYNDGYPLIYGSSGNTIGLVGNAHLCLCFSLANFSQTFTAPGIVAGFTLNGFTTAYSVSSGTLHSGIAITPANLDAAAGVSGFGGNAFILGGASISSFA